MFIGFLTNGMYNNLDSVGPSVHSSTATFKEDLQWGQNLGVED